MKSVAKKDQDTATLRLEKVHLEIPKQRKAYSQFSKAYQDSVLASLLKQQPVYAALDEMPFHPYANESELNPEILRVHFPAKVSGVYLIYDNQKPEQEAVGFILISPKLNHNGYAEEFIGFLPKYRGQGLGGQALDCLKRYLDDNHFIGKHDSFYVNGNKVPQWRVFKGVLASIDVRNAGSLIIHAKRKYYQMIESTVTVPTEEQSLMSQTLTLHEIDFIYPALKGKSYKQNLKDHLSLADKINTLCRRSELRTTFLKGLKEQHALDDSTTKMIQRSFQAQKLYRGLASSQKLLMERGAQHKKKRLR